MMYSNHFVMCVICDGQPVKELGNGVVKLPFGTEYSLRFRNKNNRRAVVNILIDGEDVSGKGYVIPANSFIDIKRHHDIDRSFKFVSLDSAEAQDFGKNGPNPDKVKGTIEARFRLEKEQLPKVIYHYHEHQPIRRRSIYPHPWDGIKFTCSTGENSGQYTCSTGEYTKSSRVGPCGSSVNPVLQDGCTVEGSMTGQTFGSVYIDLESTETVLKLFLQGFEPEVHVASTQPKSSKLVELEDKNAKLREKLLELENAELEKQIAAKTKKKRTTKPKA